VYISTTTDSYLAERCFNRKWVGKIACIVTQQQVKSELLGNLFQPGGSMRRNNIPLVQNDLLVIDNPDAGSVYPIQVGSQLWVAWLADHSAFSYEGGAGHLAARCELRRGIGYWYGYRRRNGKLNKIYLGKSKELTRERLERASILLAGELPSQRLVGDWDFPDLIAALEPQTPAISSSTGALEELPFIPLSKVKPPALPQGLLARPRLTQRINTPLTLICAPRGFGKTTLLTEWRQSCGMPVAWASLKVEDNHPLTFWSTVVTALQTVDPSLGQGWLSQLRTSSPSALSRIVVNLTNDIVRLTDAPEGPQQISLVLDHYHYIHNPEIHTSIQTWLEHLPATLKLVVASLTKPPLALGYLRAKGMVVELEADDLRFTLKEGIEYLLKNTPLPYLAYSQMQALIQRAEGWITGLVLAVSVLNQDDNRSKFKDAFTGAQPLLQDFFKENVLHTLSLEMQTFLLKTSILKSLSGPLCDAVTGQSNSAEILARLWEENRFLERLEKPGWYRYHHLFAEVLSIQLQEQFPTEIQHLHRKAAEWYSAQSAPVDTIYHLLASRSWENAAVLIEKVALNELDQLGEDSRLLGWLLQLPEEVIQQHKILLELYIRLAGISFPPSEVDGFLARIEKNITSEPMVEKNSPGQEILAEIQKFRGVWETNNQGVSEISTGGDYGIVWQMLDGIVQCYRDYRRDLIQAELEANAVYETAQARHHPYAILMAGGSCANLALSLGHLRRSEQISQQVLRQAFSLCGKFPEPASISLTALSRVCFMRNQLEQAHQFLVHAIEVNPNPTGTIEPVSMAILRAKIQSAQGQHEAAFTTIQAARELFAQRPSSVWLDQDLIAYLELFRFRTGDLDTTDTLPIDRGKIEVSAFSALVRAEILIEKKRSVAAEEILNYLINKHPHGLYMLPILRAKVILAIALFDQRKLKEASKVFIEVSRLAAPEYYIRPFLDYGPKIEALLSLVLHAENLNAGVRSFLKGILTMLGYAGGIPRALPRDESIALAIAASISPREQQILQSICAGLSNREVADQYSISASTVKTHLENIFLKLGVNSRTQAIAQAQALGLV
jgi:LuxR family transcriptional regulator, maltose regulon positive regulatory protein